MGIAIGLIRQAHDFQHIFDLLADRGFVHPLDLQTKSHILSYSQIWEKAVLLKNHPDSTVFHRHMSNVFLVQINFSATYFLQSCQTAEQCTFAASRRSQQRNQFPLLHLQLNIPEDLIGAKIFIDLFK